MIVSKFSKFWLILVGIGPLIASVSSALAAPKTLCRGLDTIEMKRGTPAYFRETVDAFHGCSFGDLDDVVEAMSRNRIRDEQGLLAIHYLDPDWQDECDSREEAGRLMDKYVAALRNYRVEVLTCDIAQSMKSQTPALAYASLVTEIHADIATLPVSKRNLLNLAAEQGRFDWVRVLQQRSSDISIIDSSGKDSLTLAIQAGSVEIALALIDAGGIFVDPKSAARTLQKEEKSIWQTLKQGYSPNPGLLIKRRQMIYELVLLFSREFKLDPPKRRIPGYAVKRGVDADTLCEALEEGVEYTAYVSLMRMRPAPGMQCKSGETPLRLAIKMRSLPLVSRLLEVGSNYFEESAIGKFVISKLTVDSVWQKMSSGERALMTLILRRASENQPKVSKYRLVDAQQREARYFRSFYRGLKAMDPRTGIAELTDWFNHELEIASLVPRASVKVVPVDQGLPLGWIAYAWCDEPTLRKIVDRDFDHGINSEFFAMVEKGSSADHRSCGPLTGDRCTIWTSMMKSYYRRCTLSTETIDVLVDRAVQRGVAVPVSTLKAILNLDDSTKRKELDPLILQKWVGALSLGDRQLLFEDAVKGLRFDVALALLKDPEFRPADWAGRSPLYWVSVVFLAQSDVRRDEMAATGMHSAFVRGDLSAMHETPAKMTYLDVLQEMVKRGYPLDGGVSVGTYEGSPVCALQDLKRYMVRRKDPNGKISTVRMTFEDYVWDVKVLQPHLESMGIDAAIEQAQCPD